MSIGGILVLLNSVLSYIPLYMLSLYKMPVKIRKRLDNLRCQFLWQGTSSERKFALVQWKKIYMLEEFGGGGYRSVRP
jgi:hypothetical protein